LVCIFCLEIFDLNEEINFDNHIQAHLKEAVNSKSSRTNSSSSRNSSTSSNSNSSSGRTENLNNLNISEQTINKRRDSSVSSNKNYILIQNFEPKPRKRL
jgi:hypothetical protein